MGIWCGGAGEERYLNFKKVSVIWRNWNIIVLLALMYILFGATGKPSRKSEIENTLTFSPYLNFSQILYTLSWGLYAPQFPQQAQTRFWELIYPICGVAFRDL